MNAPPPRCLGHVVVNVSSLAASSAFYCEVLGLREVARSPERHMIFLSFGVNDHDVALRQVERTPDGAHGRSVVGVRQIAFCIGSRIEELRGFKVHLEAHAIPIARIHEHIASTSIYLSDPDGVELEVYVEHPAKTWRGQAQAQRFSRSVRLD